MTNPRTPIDIKAAALADLEAGEQPAVVAQRYGIDRGVVKMWKQRNVSTDVTGNRTGVTVIRQPAIEAQQLALGELVQQNLRAKLIATQRIAEHVTTQAWLDKQTASDVAALFECLDRSATGILDRLAGRHNSAADAERDPA